MSKVVSIFRSLLKKQDENHLLPPIPANFDNENYGFNLGPNLTGFQVDTPIGKVKLKKCAPDAITPAGSIVSPRTSLCGLLGTRVPVTAGKPYRVLATYLGVGKRKSQIYFFQVQCDDGSIHLVNPDDCEFLGCELKAA